MILFILSLISHTGGLEIKNYQDNKRDIFERSDSDRMLREMPDIADIKISQVEIPASAAPEIKSESLEAQKKIDKIKDQVEQLKKHLGTDKIHSIADKDLWNKILEFIKKNLKDYINDGSLSIPVEVRYNFCLYIVAFVPAEVVFAIPGFYHRLIPKKAKSLPLVKEFIRKTDHFLQFIKKKSNEKFLITVYIGRTKSLADDLEFILQIPELIGSDPVKIIRFFLDFDIKSDGYVKETIDLSIKNQQTL